MKNVVGQILQFNRELRHQDNRSVNFILTGSIGLPTLAEKLDATKEINDLNVVEVPPLDRDQAQIFTRKLLDAGKLSCPDAMRNYLLDRVEWYNPFYIQLVSERKPLIFIRNHNEYFLSLHVA